MIKLVFIGSDSATWNEKEWNIITSNVPVLSIDQPIVNIEIVEPEPIDTLPGQFSFGTVRKGKHIDAHKHEALLEKNVKEHANIWRTLAEK